MLRILRRVSGKGTRPQTRSFNCAQAFLTSPGRPRLRRAIPYRGGVYKPSTVNYARIPTITLSFESLARHSSIPSPSPLHLAFWGPPA